MNLYYVYIILLNNNVLCSIFTIDKVEKNLKINFILIAFLSFIIHAIISICQSIIIISLESHHHSNTRLAKLGRVMTFVRLSTGASYYQRQ